MYKLRSFLLSTLVIGLIGLAATANQAQAFSVQENQPRGTVVGTVTINDNNGRYSLGGTAGTMPVSRWGAGCTSIT